MRIRSYTVHWRRLIAVWLPAAAVFLYRVRSDLHRGIPVWLVLNLFMVLVLLLSIRREHQGLEDDWPDDNERGNDYLRYRGGPLDARPLMWPGTDKPMGQEVVNSATMLLPQIEAPGGHYELNREKRRYEWRSHSSTPSK